MQCTGQRGICLTMNQPCMGGPCALTQQLQAQAQLEGSSCPPSPRQHNGYRDMTHALSCVLQQHVPCSSICMQPVLQACSHSGGIVGVRTQQAFAPRSAGCHTGNAGMHAQQALHQRTRSSTHHVVLAIIQEGRALYRRPLLQLHLQSLRGLGDALPQLLSLERAVQARAGIAALSEQHREHGKLSGGCELSGLATLVLPVALCASVAEARALWRCCRPLTLLERCVAGSCPAWSAHLEHSPCNPALQRAPSALIARIRHQHPPCTGSRRPQTRAASLTRL